MLYKSDIFSRIDVHFDDNLHNIISYNTIWLYVTLNNLGAVCFLYFRENSFLL